MPHITISYRRDDSGVITGRIFDRLVAQYGRDAIFRDIDDVPAGVDFRTHISQVLDETDVVLAIIGPRWFGTRGGRIRLSNEADPVRVEIEAALRQGVPLVPVLVMRGVMPQASQLPDSLRDFAFRNAVRVDDGQDFDVHMGRLVRALDRLVDRSDTAPPIEDSSPRAAAMSTAAVETAPPEDTLRPPDLLRRFTVPMLAALLGALVAASAMRYLAPSRPAIPTTTDLAAAVAARQVAETQTVAARDKAVAAQKRAEELAKQLQQAEAQLDARAAQVKSLGDQLAAEEGAHRQTLARVESLTAKNATTPSPAAATPADAEQTLSADDKRRIQSDLRTLGQLRGVADGDVGPATQAAIKEFQSFQGTTESGILSEAERRTLHEMATRLETLLQRPAASPLGVEGATVKGGAQRYARAWNFETGKGVRANPAEAVYWYGLAAADGEAKALTNLATLLVRGRAVAAADPAGAALLWQAAAARGDPTATFNLGAMWEHGIGVDADAEKAKAWYRRAAALNHPEARAALKRLGG
jgi:TPR repeat protein